MLQWKKYFPLTDKNAFICLVDSMGDDSSIVQAARVSYNKDEQDIGLDLIIETYPEATDFAGDIDYTDNSITIWKAEEVLYEGPNKWSKEYNTRTDKQAQKDRQLIRYLLNHSHTTPFEMVEIKFMVQVPMDCWRQWIRHRTASVNEYSTRYTEALDFFQITSPEEWRLQATDNKQGSSGYLEEWPEGWSVQNHLNSPDWYIKEPNSDISTLIVSYTKPTPGQYLSEIEQIHGSNTQKLYQTRLALGVAKEQARKDLPLSTYTRAYWKCDLHNIFNFLRLRMDSHAQLEIRSFANCMFEIVKQLCPIACEAFEDYVLHAKKFSRMEMNIIRKMFRFTNNELNGGVVEAIPKPSSMTDREWKEFLGKLC